MSGESEKTPPKPICPSSFSGGGWEGVFFAHTTVINRAQIRPHLAAIAVLISR
ncbi:hypothetical protein ABIE28_003918 [Devosia sp. 2618]